MYNNKIDNPVKGHFEEDNTFVQNDNRIDLLGYMHVTKDKSPREWLRDPKFAEDAYLIPDMYVTGSGAKNYQRALNMVSNFRTKVSPRSQQDYQREMYFNKFDTSEADRLIFLNNALDAAWNNKKDTYKNERQRRRAYEQYVKQKKNIHNNLKNMGDAADKIISNEQWMDEFNRLGHVWNTQVFPTLIGTTMLSGYSSPWSIGSGTTSAGRALSYSIPQIAWESTKRIATDPRTYVSILGGAAVDKGVELLSDGEYKSVGDYVYNASGLNQLLDGTWAEDPARYVAEIVNPGYHLPYSKIANAGSLIDDAVSALQNKGFFNPSENITHDNALAMNWPNFRKPLTLEKVNARANEKNMEITGVKNLTKKDLSNLNKYVKRQNPRNGEPRRYIYQENGQFKYDHGLGTPKYNLDLNNLPNSNIGIWNWMKEHKWPFIGLGSLLTTGIGPYIAGRMSRNVVDIGKKYEEGFNSSESQEPSKPNEQTELSEIPIGYIQNTAILQDSTDTKW